MNCEQAQQELLQCEDPRRAPRGDTQLAQHMRSCAGCRAVARKLVALEQAVWVLPVPESLDSARTVFLERLVRQPVTLRPRPLALRGRALRTWTAAAALVLAAVGLGTWLLTQRGDERPVTSGPSDQQPHRAITDVASDTTTIADEPGDDEPSELLDRLIAWNLDLTEAALPSERDRVYVSQAAVLKKALEQEPLADLDRSLAEKLLETGALLARNDDPVIAADLLDDVADELLDRLNSAAGSDDVQAINRFGKRLSRVAEQGINAKLDRAEATTKLTPDHQRRLEKIHQRSGKRVQVLTNVVNRAPPKSQKQVRRAMEAADKTHKRKGQGKKKG